jgi:glycerol transport system ATP-binding protein
MKTHHSQPIPSQGLELRNLDKIVKREVHLKDINLTLNPGERYVVLGRTLAGKTSLLRILAGLDRPTTGSIILNGRDLTGVSVRKRSVAVVYQQFINYPPLTVYKNIASPLTIAGADKKEIDRRVNEIARMLHIESLLDRMPNELSGGQQQRVAIARALVKKAELLLMDEPLVNLDYKLREELRVELQEIFNRREAIVVYTTTEPTEALLLGGNVIVMDKGRILQTGSTSQVYHNPINTTVAEVFSDPPINYLSGSVKGSVAVMGSDIEIPLNDHMRDLTEGEYIFGVRCNHMFLKRTSPEDAEIQVEVDLAEINGSETFIHVRYEDTRLVVQEDGVHPRHIGSKIPIYASPCCFFVYSPDGRLVASPSLTSIRE